ncbi:MAG: TonB-dependent receptor plug domain-containing protein [Bacteroidales bacterium]|nr:TonB-dependent receptor plug domain-containing protein [Bacteroidales bacterium]
MLINYGLQAQISSPQNHVADDSLVGMSKTETGSFSAVNLPQPVSSEKIDFSGLSFTNELSLFELIQGRIGGLDITSASGNPGNSPLAVLRGQQVLDNRYPLIVIDGIPWKSNDHFFNIWHSGMEDLYSLIPVSASDINSVEVLKDGASTALYGAEGADGVILIETKKGIAQKMHVTYQFNQGIIREPEFLPMLSGDEYIIYQLEAYHNAGIMNLPPEITYDPDYVGFYNYSANTDWLKAVTQKGSLSNHHLSIHGGNKKSRYYGSIGYLDQNGTVIHTRNNRFMGRLNFEHDFTDKITLALHANYVHQKHNDNVVVEDEYGYGKSILEMAFVKAPNISIWDYDTDGNRTGDYFAPINNYQGNGLDYYNPVAVSSLGEAIRKFNELSATSLLEYNFKNWLKFREFFTYQRSSADEESFLPNYAINSGGLAWATPAVNSRNDLKFQQFRNEFQAIVKLPFKEQQRNSLNGVLSLIMQHDDYSISPDSVLATNRPPNRNINAIVLSLHYKHLNKYIVNANTRLESVSNIDNKHTWDKNYGVSIGWCFAEEPFVKKLQILSETSMIRAGWSFSKFQPGGYFQLPLPYTNPEIEIMTCNIGLGLGLFHDRVYANMDYYCKETWKKNLYGAAVDAMFQVRSKGWEMMVNYEVIKKKNFDWDLYFSTAHNRQILVEAPVNINNSESATLRNGSYVSLLYENKPLGSIYGLNYEGVYSTDQDAIAVDRDGNILYDNNGSPIRVSYENYAFQGGDAKYRDVNFDGTIDEGDLVELGNSYPKFTGGFGSTVRFKNFSFTCNFHYRTGYQIINQVAMDSEGLYSKHNQNTNVLNRWRYPGQHGDNMVPRAYLDHPANNLGSDRFVENGSFLRMNYINLTYQFGPEICRKIRVQDLCISLSGQRLFTMTGYNGSDPETELHYSGVFSLNPDEIRVYPPKIYTFSVKITL